MMTALAAAPVGARAILKTKCEAIHRRLDARFSSFDLGDRRSYAAMLSCLSGPVTALESALATGVASRLFYDLPERLRSLPLSLDLRDLGGALHVRAGAPIEDEAEAFGVLYVLEGSRLGGRVLAQRAAASPDVKVRNATRYFRHAEQAGHWRSFLSRLEQSQAVQAAPERASAAALGAFAAFEAALA
jgi:heme oxygenase (biliverdin-IX-beta and delta-forming)